MSDVGQEVDRPLKSRRMSDGVECAGIMKVDDASFTARAFDQEPSRVSIANFRTLLISCVMSGASDITIQSDQPPRAEIHGNLYKVTRRAWSPSEVDMILAETYGGANARTEINSQNVLDYAYEINLSDGTKQRFRVNAIGIFGQTGSGVEITLRALPTKTPRLGDLGIGPAESDALVHRNGIIIIGGETGSGKSTLLAGVICKRIEDPGNPSKIIDIQAPIEFTYRDIRGSSSLIGQSEVGRHVPSFAAATRSCLRRSPRVIVVGEARDLETIRASMECAVTGHAVYTTTHANSVSTAIRRLLGEFSGPERESRAYDLISSLRLIMVQHLAERCDIRGRIAIREYLRVTDRLRGRLLSLPPSEWPGIIEQEVRGDAPDLTEDDMCQSLTAATREAYLGGKIDWKTALGLGGAKAVKGSEA